MKNVRSHSRFSYNGKSFFSISKKENAKSLVKLAKIACYLAVSCITNWNEKSLALCEKVWLRGLASKWCRLKQGTFNLRSTYLFKLGFAATKVLMIPLFGLLVFLNWWEERRSRYSSKKVHIQWRKSRHSSRKTFTFSALYVVYISNFKDLVRLLVELFR